LSKAAAISGNNSKALAWNIWTRAGLDVLNALTHVPSWMRLSHEIQPGHQVADDFIGVNIATSNETACDDEVIRYLDDLAIRYVRMDYSYCSPRGDAQRLLNRVLEHGCDVMLDLFAPVQEAKVLGTDKQAQQRWREFLLQVFSEYSSSISVFEIGNTPNRGKWSGFDGVSYLRAWNIAAEVAESFELKLAGPNISDFEPLYNFAYLKAMKRTHSVPNIHTDNLFVERVIQPEAYDHRVAGKRATRKLNLNLVKKARIINRLGKTLGCDKTFCTYKCWSRKRLSRWTTDPEQKNANYLSRYLFIAAASGALDRVYWGPLICNRDGLVDCGDENYPHIDNVSFYKEVRGNVANFKTTKGYDAFKYIASLLRGVSCKQGVTADNGLNHFVFENAQGKSLHAIWCLDGYSLLLNSLYSQQDLDRASINTVYGQHSNQAPVKITEQPLILQWDSAPDCMSVEQISRSEYVVRYEVLEDKSSDLQQVKVENHFWRGMVAVPKQADVEQEIAKMMPASLTAAQELIVLRDTRNRLWNVSLDGNDNIHTVKLNRAKGIKKFSYRFLDSKGKRHWDNATEMLRRGVNTPQPSAYFERPDNSGIRENYYVCQFISNAFSARDVFAAFNAGELTYRGIIKEDMFDLMAAFIANMHSHNIVHRDLSSGNLMMTLDGAELQFYVIDIGRAAIDKVTTIQPKHRFVDLKRICYKLAWDDRALFINAYNRCLNEPLPSSWKLSLKSYDWKLSCKRALKAKIKKLKGKI